MKEFLASHKSIYIVGRNGNGNRRWFRHLDGAVVASRRNPVDVVVRSDGIALLQARSLPALFFPTLFSLQQVCRIGTDHVSSRAAPSRRSRRYDA